MPTCKSPASKTIRLFEQHGEARLLEVLVAREGLREAFLRFLAVLSGMKSDVWSLIIGFANPNGIESSSPRLRGNELPWVRS
jgi:hypothetical protein